MMRPNPRQRRVPEPRPGQRGRIAQPAGFLRLAARRLALGPVLEVTFRLVDPPTPDRPGQVQLPLTGQSRTLSVS
jgi:hypothetical protein